MNSRMLSPGTLALLMLVTSSGLAAQPEAIDFDELMNRVRDYRLQHFDTGKVVLHVETSHSKGDSSEFEMTLWVDGDRWRKDRRNRRPGRQDWSRSSKYIVDTDRTIEDRAGSNTVEIRPRDESEIKQSAFFHPRALGMGYDGISRLYERGIDSLVINPRRAENTIRREELNGRSVLRLEGRYPTGVHYRIWIDPNQGYSVVQTLQWSPSGSQSSETTWQQLGRRKIWYPRSVKSGHFDTEGFYRGQQVTVVSADFESPVPEDVFTLRGLNLTPDRDVRLHPFNTYSVAARVPERAPVETMKLNPGTPSDPGTPAAESARSTWIVPVIFMSLLALALFVHAWRSSSESL